VISVCSLSERTKENTPVALTSLSATSWWKHSKTSDGADLIRDAMRYVFQELIKSEATTVIGAGLYERTENRMSRKERSFEDKGHRSRRG